MNQAKRWQSDHRGSEDESESSEGKPLIVRSGDVGPTIDPNEIREPATLWPVMDGLAEEPGPDQVSDTYEHDPIVLPPLKDIGRQIRTWSQQGVTNDSALQYVEFWEERLYSQLKNSSNASIREQIVDVLSEAQKFKNQLIRSQAYDEGYERARAEHLGEKRKLEKQVAELEQYKYAYETQKKRADDHEARLQKTKDAHKKEKQTWDDKRNELVEKMNGLVKQIEEKEQTIVTLTAERDRLQLDWDDVIAGVYRAQERRQIRGLLIENYDESEFEDLVFDLGLTYGKVASSRAKLIDNVRDLITYCERRRLIGNLVEIMKETREYLEGTLAQLVMIPPEQPIKKVQLIIRGHQEIDEEWLISYLAEKLELPIEEVGILSKALGSIRFLLGLPAHAEKKLMALLDDPDFFKDYNVKIDPYEVLSKREQVTWREIATNEKYAAADDGQPIDWKKVYKDVVVGDEDVA